MKTVIARRGSDEPVVAELAGRNVAANDVRVAVAAAAFTYFDAFVPAHQEALGLPDQVGLGFDFSGIVTEVGPDVRAIAVGDRVAGLHTDITAPVRAHSEELVIDAGALAAVPDRFELAVAAAVPLSALTARQALDLLGSDQGRLLVTGAAGSVGGWLIELASREGWDVTALVKPGTEHLVETKEVTTELTGSYDAVLDAAALHGPALAAVRDGGRYVGFKPGQPQTPERGITVHTVQVVPDGESLGTLLPLAADGVVPVRIAGRAPLADATTAYARGSSESGSRGRWLLVPEHPNSGRPWTPSVPATATLEPRRPVHPSPSLPERRAPRGPPPRARGPKVGTNRAQSGASRSITGWTPWHEPDASR